MSGGGLHKEAAVAHDLMLRSYAGMCVAGFTLRIAETRWRRWSRWESGGVFLFEYDGTE